MHTTSASAVATSSSDEQLAKLIALLSRQQLQQSQQQQQQAQLSQALLQQLAQVSAPTAPVSTSNATFPKLRSLDDEDDAEQWFIATERLLNGHQVNHSRHGLAVIPYLKGKALSAYKNLPTTSQTFADIKAAVLARFRLDAEEYRQRYDPLLCSPPAVTTRRYVTVCSICSKNGCRPPYRVALSPHCRRSRMRWSGSNWLLFCPQAPSDTSGSSLSCTPTRQQSWPTLSSARARAFGYPGGRKRVSGSVTCVGWPTRGGTTVS